MNRVEEAVENLLDKICPADIITDCCSGGVPCCCDNCGKVLRLWLTELLKIQLDEIDRAMYHECFEVSHEEDGLQKWDGGNWIRYKLFENVMDRLKEQKECYNCENLMFSDCYGECIFGGIVNAHDTCNKWRKKE